LIDLAHLFNLTPIFVNYSQLLDAFKETHEESNMLVLLNNRLKGLNNQLENQANTLKEELSHSKPDFENLEIIYKNSSCKFVDSSFFLKTMIPSKRRFITFLKIVNKFSKGQSNFETVFASQSCVFGKAGMGFNPNNKNKTFTSAHKKNFYNFF